MILDDKLLDEVTARAKTSERLRMNFNLHDSLDAKAQRLLNALGAGHGAARAPPSPHG